MAIMANQKAMKNIMVAINNPFIAVLHSLNRYL